MKMFSKQVHKGSNRFFLLQPSVAKSNENDQGRVIDFRRSGTEFFKVNDILLNVSINLAHMMIEVLIE